MIRAVEVVQHQLSLVVRPQDHFSGQAWPRALLVTLNTNEPPVATSEGPSRLRHADGTYRFLGLAAGMRQVSVNAADGSVFTWDPFTVVNVPLLSPATPLVIEVWPSASATGVSPGGSVIRGRLLPSIGGQEVQMQVVGVVPARIRRARTDLAGEFTFSVVGPVALDNGKIRLAVTVPGHALNSIQIIDGITNPTTLGTELRAVPGAEVRVHFNIT